MEKIKVVWLCHFSNQQVRNRLPLTNWLFLNRIRKLFGVQQAKYFDYAAWITNLVHEFEKIEDIELHIISPHVGMKELICHFESNGIHYHFFKAEIQFRLNMFFGKILKHVCKDFGLNRLIIKKILKNINPRLVNLIGTENPYYSLGTLDIENIPVYVSVQTVYTNPDRLKLSGNLDQFIWDMELKIHQKEKYFGCGGRMHRDLIIKNNPNAIIFKNFFLFEKPNFTMGVNKEFDFVFFAAQVNNKKGIEDALEALAIVKQKYQGVTLNVVGQCDPLYKVFLEEKIDKLGIQENVIFNTYFPVHSDMHKHICKSRFALLPLKLDIISSTLIEAIWLGLPVVTYKTTGTPYLNKDGESVLIADIGDINSLSKNMLKLLNSPELAEKLQNSAKKIVNKEFDNTVTARRWIENYDAVIHNFYYGHPIPENLLFDLKEFPIY